MSPLETFLVVVLALMLIDVIIWLLCIVAIALWYLCIAAAYGIHRLGSWVMERVWNTYRT